MRDCIGGGGCGDAGGEDMTMDVDADVEEEEH